MAKQGAGYQDYSVTQAEMSAFLNELGPPTANQQRAPAKGKSGPGHRAKNRPAPGIAATGPLPSTNLVPQGLTRQTFHLTQPARYGGRHMQPSPVPQAPLRAPMPSIPDQSMQCALQDQYLQQQFAYQHQQQQQHQRFLQQQQQRMQFDQQQQQHQLEYQQWQAVQHQLLQQQHIPSLAAGDAFCPAAWQ